MTISQWLGTELWGFVGTIISTIAIYLAFLLIVRIMGQRLLVGLTTFDTLMVLLFGSIVARTALGPKPTLAVGLTALITLTILHFLLGKFANTHAGDAALNSNAQVLMAGSEMLTENMQSTNTTPRELMSALRSAGIRQLSDVAAVIIEPTGKLSIYRAEGTCISCDMLEGVVDADKIPAEYLS